METLIIADRDVDQAQATMLAVRNAGFDDPIFYVRSGAALLARLSGSAQKAKPPAAIWIGLELLRDCGPELARCLRLAETPIALTAMLSSDRERSQLEQCGFRNVDYVVRPIKPSDVLRLLGLRGKSKTPVQGNPKLLWEPTPLADRPPGLQQQAAFAARAAGQFADMHAAK
ncbi:MAG TPA: hypothetical protein VN725_02290 [Rhodanobacteraceae bacterium]|nr:hypothetical protein [Rhodanobacteraceae bacterium]